MYKVVSKIPAVLRIIFLSILGFVAGVLMIALWQENWFIKEGIVNQNFITEIERMNIDKRALFFLCFGRRIRAFFLLFVLAFSSVNMITVMFFFLVNGIYMGSLMELFAIRYGMQGIAMYLSVILPQGISYVFGFWMLGCWCLKQEEIKGNAKDKKLNKLRNIKNKRMLIISFILIMVGIILESYVNPKIFFFFI